MSKNANLHRAKNAKNDEFYTQKADIEAELALDEEDRYKHHFKDKTVFLNCDDPRWSEFWKFFNSRFTTLGLKKLISTHYEPTGKPSYALIQERERERVASSLC